MTGRVGAVMTLCVVFSIACPCCCGSSPRGQPMESGSEHDRVSREIDEVQAVSPGYANATASEFTGLVNVWRALPSESRNAEALRLARELEVGYGDDKPRTFKTLVIELVEQGLADTLNHLDKILVSGPQAKPVSKREMLHIVVSASRNQDSMQPLLKALAARNLTSFPLAPFRPGGISYLLDVLEDPEFTAEDRAECADYLKDWAGPDVLPRLEKLRGDSTPVDSLWGIPFEQETLGQHVAEAIEGIQARERYRAAQSGESDD